MAEAIYAPDLDWTPRLRNVAALSQNIALILPLQVCHFDPVAVPDGRLLRQTVEQARLLSSLQWLCCAAPTFADRHKRALTSSTSHVQDVAHRDERNARTIVLCMAVSITRILIEETRNHKPQGCWPNVQGAETLETCAAPAASGESARDIPNHATSALESNERCRIAHRGTTGICIITESNHQADV